MLYRHKHPARITVSIPIGRTGTTKDTLDAMRTNNLDLHSSSEVMFNPNPNVDMLQNFEIILVQQFLRDRHLALQTCWWYQFASRIFPVGTECAIVQLNRLGLHPRLRFDKFPRLGSFNVSVSIQHTIAVLVAVLSTGGGEFPVWIIFVDNDRVFDAKMLDVSPCKVRAKIKV